MMIFYHYSSSPYAKSKKKTFDKANLPINLVQITDSEELKEAVIKLENELKHSKNVIQKLDARAGPMRIDDTDSSNESDICPNVDHESEQIDSVFSGAYIFTTNVSFFSSF